MKITRTLWASCGFILVGLGLIGVIVPGMPTTIFMILALYCFRKGSSRFENWLLSHKVFGPTLRDWEKHKGIRHKTKIVAVTTLAVFIAISVGVILTMSKKPWVVAIVVGTGVLVSWYILSRPTVPDSPQALEEPVPATLEDQAYLG